MHLDILNKHIPAMAGQLSQGVYEHMDGSEYASKKIQSLHEAISEYLEALNMEKWEKKSNVKTWSLLSRNIFGIL